MQSASHRQAPHSHRTWSHLQDAPPYLERIVYSPVAPSAHVGKNGNPLRNSPFPPGGLIPICQSHEHRYQLVCHDLIFLTEARSRIKRLFGRPPISFYRQIHKPCDILCRFVCRYPDRCRISTQRNFTGPVLPLLSEHIAISFSWIQPHTKSRREISFSGVIDRWRRSPARRNCNRIGVLGIPGPYRKMSIPCGHTNHGDELFKFKLEITSPCRVASNERSSRAFVECLDIP